MVNERVNEKLHLPHTRLSASIEHLILKLGDGVSWIWLLLLAVIVLNVIMRYVFSEGRIEFEEIQWHLYAVGFLIGLSYGVVNDSHIRVDVLREKCLLLCRPGSSSTAQYCCRSPLSCWFLWLQFRFSFTPSIRAKFRKPLEAYLIDGLLKVS